MSSSHPTQAVNLLQTIPEVFESLGQVHGLIDAHGLARKLHHLVVLRASQINQCGFCVKMHTREAREDGESNERLDRLVVWRHVSDFNAAERAALAWTEALTVLCEDTDFGPLRAALREHFSDAQIAALTADIGMINLWNRLQVSRH
ncbi:carboxymuconolactone decarboxylase family protein [Pseudomonas chlororaphis]|uniref:Carboxymuconolactone decarboxylase family protein n=1 Tax=Pseudomonas chlororaphis TaxID=587753 RepID=A0AB34C5Y5_9PSED|nr:carboxymuconolactone decarboxylase family protein [Pseudomonas chlororaphis]KAA5842562.1 carboxymuconolactone decarboxylase family protein [Pseudomonas chlororaphis]